MKHDPLTVFTAWQGPLGAMTLAATPRGLSGVWFAGQRHGPDTSPWRRDPDHPVLRQALEQLTQYFAGYRQHFELPLHRYFLQLNLSNRLLHTTEHSTFIVYVLLRILNLHARIRYVLRSILRLL